MSDPRAIPDEERPFIPEEQIPAKESTDFDAQTAEPAGPGSDVDADSDPEPDDSLER
jgi:hypothetical protein